jgi:CDP-paratose 2-epimerase
MRVLVTGGAGFIGANVAVTLSQRHDDWEVVALDNLKRRGSEVNVPRLREADVTFVHGDVRETEDLATVGTIDALVECSAEPSALAGRDGATGYVVHTNLLGAYNCLELARRERAQLVFLSTSRVYPVDALSSVRYREGETRFELEEDQPFPGVSGQGVSERFPLEGPRTLYGATKLAAELLIAEYGRSFGLRAVVDRCGVVAGPWQMGKVDQGVFAYWLLAHHFGHELTYVGYGGSGKQVRDLLHVDDLTELVDEQLKDSDHWAGAVVNVGGGVRTSLSLLETTELCRELTGNPVRVHSTDAARPGDVPIYISDCSMLRTYTDWRPQRDAMSILSDIYTWIVDNERMLETALAEEPVFRSR